MDKRWVLIRYGCEGGFGLSGAGDPGVNGFYCPDGEHLGYPRWTKTGGVSMEDSVHIITAGPSTSWVVTSGGTYASDPLNVKAYSDFTTFAEPSPPDNTWITSTGGTYPPPANGAEGPAEVIRVLECKTPCKFVDEADLSIGLIAKRRKLTTNLIFRGDDFNFFLGYERWGHRRCEELTIRREWKCGNRWRTFWDGTFSTGAGSWDLGKCEFTVKPKVKDHYSCITDALNKKVNVLQVAPVTARAIAIPSLEFAVCTIGLPVWCTDVYDIDGVTPINEYDFAHNQIVPDCGVGYTAYILWRERVTTECVAGAPVSPPGVGWVVLSDDCGTIGTATYVRNSTIPWTFGDATVVETMSETMPPNPDSTCAWTYAGSIFVEDEVNPFCFGIYHHFFICLSSGDTTDFDRARLFRSAFEYTLEKACPNLEVVSDFFEWDAPGDAPGYIAGANYVTQGPNQHSAWALVQMSDAIDPTATNPATRGELTLKDFFVLMTTGPKVFWRLDDLGRLRLEHWTYWTFPVDLDLTIADNVIEPMAYSHLSVEVPRIERPKWAAALNRDFAVSDIIYSGPCVTDNENDVKEYAAGPFVTDISFIISDPDAQSKEGFALLATAYNGTEYDTIIAPGALTTDTISNAPLSWANLERDFWTWDRFLAIGTMNGVEQEFDGTQPTIEQKGVAVTLCCDLFDIDTTHSVRSRLQAKLGTAPAYAQRVEIDDTTGRAYLTLRYAY